MAAFGCMVNHAPWEESPDSTRQRCRVTPGRGNPRESATENKPPRMRGQGETVG